MVQDMKQIQFQQTGLNICIVFSKCNNKTKATVSAKRLKLFWQICTDGLNKSGRLSLKWLVLQNVAHSAFSKSIWINVWVNILLFYCIFYSFVDVQKFSVNFLTDQNYSQNKPHCSFTLHVGTEVSAVNLSQKINSQIFCS